MDDKICIFVPEDSEGIRIDKYISNEVNEISRSRIVSLIDDGMVLVNSKQVSKSYKCEINDKIEITVPPPKNTQIAAEDIPIDVVWEDEDLLVVNKPKGMVVHPAPGNYSGTLVNALLYRYEGQLSGINGVLRPGIVHRIDKDTSGLLIVAKNDMAHEALSKQISEHSFHREYECVAHGVFKDTSGTISAPIGRDPKDRKKMAVTQKNSKSAITHYEVISQFNKFAQLRCRLETGRTHQIRVHLAYIAHPLAGDTVYGPKNTPRELKGQCLHAKHIGFTHPRTGEWLEFESELPDYYKAFLEKIRRNT